MSMPSWILRHPNARTGRFQRTRRSNKEDDINLDLNTEPKKNILHVLSAICQNSDQLTDGKLLQYLNAFVKLTLKIEGQFEQIGFKFEDILRCLRIPLLHDSTQIRSGGLRAIRHVIRDDSDICILNQLSIPYLVARSLDLLSVKDVERIESMKLIRKIMLISPGSLHMSLSRCLVSLAIGGAEEKDRLLRICLATLCELGVTNSELFIASGGVGAITMNLCECQTPKIAEALCGVLLLFLDKPATREKAAVDLHAIVAPYCDFQHNQGWKENKEKYLDERELRFNCSRLALLSILRSWSGVLHFCSPLNKSGLKAVVEALYLKQLEVRKAVLDLLYELLNLPQPEWTDELSVALSAVDPCEPQSSWRLNEGFVAAEGRSILPHLAKATPSINEMHLAMLLYSFLECGLLGAIVEVIATSDTFISVRATILLGELLHLIQTLLPPECCNISPALPSLLEYATQGMPLAVKAVNGLQLLQKMLRCRPAAYSLYLDLILRSGNNLKFSNASRKKSKHKLKVLKNKLHQLYSKDGEDVIKETGVLLSEDAYTWNWSLIRLIINGEAIRIDWTNPSHKNFVKRLIDFYSPSRNRYSHMDLTTSKVSLAYTMTGVELITNLLEAADDDSFKFLRELFGDIAANISAITEGRSVHDCLFSPQHMNSTQCQSYFLFIGCITSHEIGISLLNSLELFRKLENLAVTTNNDCYVKLIVSSLDYNNAGHCRELLKSVLKCPVESSRLYATQFLVVLLRAGTQHFYDWGIPLLCDQLADKSKAVQLIALSTLHEACEVEECLVTLARINPDLKGLGEKGVLLKVRLFAVAESFDKYAEAAVAEVKHWDARFNCRYVKLVEDETCDTLTLHQRDEDGKYDKRTSAVRSNSKKDVFLPPHLYGQLGRHAEGAVVLLRHGSLDRMLRTLEECVTDTDPDIIQMKSSLWALGHFGSTQEGLMYLVLHNCVATIIALAQHCPVYSIRATAYYVLGLIATSRVGADELFKLGWFCTRHNRHVVWPIIEEEAWTETDVEDEDSLRILQYNLAGHADPAVGDLYFFGAKDFEGGGSTDDEVSESISALPGQQRSLTLPANQNAPSAYHKRSLSESKTFEMIKSKSNFKSGNEVRRVRNNSTTESTTSGVSSCDSAGRSVIYEPKQILSPIPSSCSLSTLKQSAVKLRRHSESSRRISTQSGSTSDKSSHSLAGSSGNRLSHQDLLGYATLRSLRRRSPRYLEDISYAPCENARGEESVWDVSASFNEDSTLFDASFSTLKRFTLSENERDVEERCYIGITLPQSIQVLFVEPQARPEDATEVPTEIAQSNYTLERIEQHCSATACWTCQAKSPPKPFKTAGNDLDVVSALILVEEFSNPMWLKQEKYQLLQSKQKYPLVYQDPCVYVEVCKILTDYVYLLLPRRMLHELFASVNFTDLYLDAKNTVEKMIRESSSEKEVENDKDAVATCSNIKKLDALKLAYKENKFPIRERNESNIV